MGAQRARPSAVLVPATCDATHHIDAIGLHDALAAARMAKCVEMHCQQFAHRDKPRGRPHPHTANSGRYRAFLLRKNARQNARQNARWHLPHRAFPAVRSQNARLPCVSYRAFHIFCRSVATPRPYAKSSYGTAIQAVGNTIIISI